MNEAWEGKQCRLIEVAHSLNQRNIFVDLYDELETWCENQPDVDLYSSYFRYYTDDPHIGPVLAGFGMDFDDAERPRRAQKEALAICKFLIDKYDVKEQDLSICFSGGKGFHVWVNHAVLGVEPQYHLPKIHKQMAKELIDNLGLKTLDLQIYDRRRLIRLPNTRHQKTGLYKVHLSLSELENLSIQQIKADLAIKTRPWPHIEHHDISERLNHWYIQHKNAYMEKLREKREYFEDEDFTIDRMLPCVKKRLEIGAEEGLRNRCAWQLASYFCQKGTALEECLSIMKQWHHKLDSGLHPYSWSECEKSIRATYDRGGYGIGCGSEYVENLCVGKESCPIFVKIEASELPEEAYEQAEKILSEDPLEYITNTVNIIHVGDQDLIKIAYISALSAQLGQTIHLWPIGTSQKGKSHSLYSTRYVLPKEHYEIFTSASPKSLFYYAKKYGEECFNGKLLFIDEVESSRLTLPMLRSLTSPIDIQPRHLSVYDAKILDLKISGPRVIWFTSVKAFGADQLRNRFVFVNPDESEDQDEAVFELQKNEEIEKPEELKTFQTAQAMTKKILEETKNLNVEIPYIQDIQWPYKNKRWLFPVFKSFLEILTKINFKQRQKTEQKIVSEKEDFQTTKRLWGTFLKTILFRVSEPAEKLLSRLESNPDHAKTKAELAEQMGYSTRHIGRIIEELDEAQLINQRKRQKEGPGRLAWEYWKTKTPGINKVKLISDISDPLFEGSEKKNSESKTPKKRVKNVRNSGQNNSDINDTTSMSTKEKFSESETEKNHVTNVQNSGKYSLCINCGEPIHPDDPDTFYEGEHMHLKCYHKLMKGRR